jgi:ABC-type molybdate transport system ATPase subunit
MLVIYTSKGMSKKVGVRVIYRKIRYIQQDATLHSLFYLETALHVSCGTITNHQEDKQLYLQHLLFVTPLLLSAAIMEELELV